MSALLPRLDALAAGLAAAEDTARALQAAALEAGDRRLAAGLDNVIAEMQETGRLVALAKKPHVL